jgi:hypothetical protein
MVRQANQRRQRPRMIRFELELEQRLAAMAAHYTWEVYNELPGDEAWVGLTGSNSKAMVIATYRASQQIGQALHGS